MTQNGHFALKSVSGSATNGLASPASTPASQNYEHRHRTHNRSLPDRAGHLSDANFISRMLFKDTDWFHANSIFTIFALSLYSTDSYNDWWLYHFIALEFFRCFFCFIFHVLCIYVVYCNCNCSLSVPVIKIMTMMMMNWLPGKTRLWNDRYCMHRVGC